MLKSRFLSPCLLPRVALQCRGGWILWVLAPSSWTSRLSPRGLSSWKRMARPPPWSRGTARTSPLPSPSGQTSTPRSSSCESHSWALAPQLLLADGGGCSGSFFIQSQVFWGVFVQEILISLPSIFNLWVKF